MKTYCGNGGIAPHIDLGTRWRLSGQLYAQAALSPGKEPLVPTGEEDGWASEPAGCGGEEKNSQPCRESNHRSSDPQPSAIPLSYPGFYCYNNKGTNVQVKVHVNVKLSLGLTMHHAMKTYWGNGGIAPWILILGTRWK
jgi:hypothetical protein